MTAPSQLLSDLNALQVARFSADHSTLLDPITGAPVTLGGGSLGPYATTAALQTAKPAASNSGVFALVGASAPYAMYYSDGTAWDELAGLAFFIVSTASASLTLKPGRNKIVITYNGNVTLNLTSPYDAEYEATYAAGSSGTVTVNGL
jgi:hypothetical protein